MAITVVKRSAPHARPKSVAPSPWSPFRSRVFTVIWTATVVANIGSWMYNAAAGWLMTSLDTDALSVSLVQVASGLPMFLFAMPAGALEHFCVRWDRIRHWRDNSGTRWAEPGRGAGRRFAIEPLWCARPPCAVAL